MEHLTWHQRSWSLLVRHFGDWNVGVGERGVCTLLGPEGPGAAVLVVAVPLGLFLFPVLPVVGEGTARTLRTTQWTRAS